MSDNFDSATEPAAPVAPKTIESKLVVSTTVATVLYVLLGIVADNTAVLDGLPPWVKAGVVAVLPTLLAFLAGYRVPSNRL